jgi:hypothetical protein
MERNALSTDSLAGTQRSAPPRRPHLSLKQMQKKRANPGYNPDIDDPGTPLGSLVADLMNQTISPAQSA